MDQHNVLVYHQATFDLLDEKPQIERLAVEMLDRIERGREVHLPASVREWYSLKHAVAILSRNPVCGYAYEVERLGAVDTYWSGGTYHEIDLVQKGLLPLMGELQGVCTWAVQLNGTDDPPVVLSFDNTMPFAKWELSADTFSAFVYTCAWDSQVYNPEDVLFGWKRELLPAELTFFHQHFQEGPQTYTYPGVFNYRFFSDKQRILIYEGEQGTSLYFSAPTDEELKRLMETVWQCTTLKREMHLDRNGITVWEEMFPDDTE
jgi:hypothetical protein